MSAHTSPLPLRTTLANASLWQLYVSLICIYLIYSICSAVYELYFSPLAKFPGPVISKISRLPRFITTLQGREVPYVAGLHAKYGSVVRLAPRELSFIEGARAWRDIYGPHNGLAGRKDPLFYTKPAVGLPSLWIANDSDHARMRKVLGVCFSDSAMKDQEPLLKRWAAYLSEKLGEKEAIGEPANMCKLYNCTTFDIMGDLTFSTDLHMLRNGELSSWVQNIFRGTRSKGYLRAIKIFPWGRFIAARFERSAEAVKRTMLHFANTQALIDRRIADEPAYPDLWTRVLAKEAIEGARISPAERTANAAIFMVAGTETTATTLTGVTWFVLQNPDCYQKLVTEIRSEWQSQKDFTLERLARMKYLNAVIQEGLRMYPPIPIAASRRTPPEGATVCGEYVPGDVGVGAHHWATYRSEMHFALPNEYHPERWLGADPRFKNDHRDASEPFSIGVRNCIGQNLALHEMRIVLATVLLHYDLKLADPVAAASWLDQKSWFLWEKPDLYCVLTRVPGKS